MKSFLKSLLLLSLCGAASAQSPWNTTTFPPGFTATGPNQTSAPLNLGTAPLNRNGAYSVGIVTLTGTALTSVTFSVLVSGDNGVSFHPWPIVAVPSSGTVITSATATANAIYSIDLSGLTSIEFVTLSNFNATSVNFLLTASPNGSVTRSSNAQPAIDLPLMDGTPAMLGSSLLYAREDHVHPTDTSRAPLNSPVFTGDPTAPTATGADANQIVNVGYLAANTPAVPQPATAVPLIDGTPAVGTSTLYARQDHVHPTDTTRAPVPLKATTAAIGGALINLGCTSYATVNVQGALSTMTCVMSGANYLQAANSQPQCFVSAANTVTPQLCTSITLGITPAAGNYNVRVFQ